MIVMHVTSSTRDFNIEIAPLESRQGQAGIDSNGGSKLTCCQQISPEQRTTDDLLRHDNNIAGVEPGGEHIGVKPPSRVASNNGTIRANDEYLFPIRGTVCTAGAAEIPGRGFSRRKRECCRVIDLTADKYESRPLRNRQYVTSTQFDIGGRVRPTIDIGADVNYHTAGRRMTLQISDHLGLLLLDGLQFPGPSCSGQARREPGG